MVEAVHFSGANAPLILNFECTEIQSSSVNCVGRFLLFKVSRRVADDILKFFTFITINKAEDFFSEYTKQPKHFRCVWHRNLQERESPLSASVSL